MKYRVLRALSAAALLVGISIVPLATTPAQAYVHLGGGCKWNSNPKITWTNAATGAYYWPAANAAADWSNTTDILLDSTGGVIRAYQENKGDTDFEGITYWGCIWGSMTKADITLNTYYTNSYTERRKQAVFAHEFGHGLGLDHTNYPNQVMNTSASTFYFNTGRWWPQWEDDIPGINALY